MERGANGVPYNVGSDEAVSISGLAKLIAEVLHVKSEVIIQKKPLPGVKPSRYVPDIARAKALGLEITVPLRSAIELSAR